jgi:sigma-B regulation protein RsbU (phosphoserine phosphatase)
MRHCGQSSVLQLDGAQHLPLGISTDVTFANHEEQLHPGDQIVFYTDGITEAPGASGAMFGTERLDRVLGCCSSEPAEIVDSVLAQLAAHTGGAAPQDDRTLVVARII